MGHGPVIETLAALARSAGYAVATLPGETVAAALRGLALGPDASVVVATHGELDEDALTQVLGTRRGLRQPGGQPQAGRERSSATLHAARGVPPERLGRLKAPAGLDIGAVTPEEIAVSILAEIIQRGTAARRTTSRRPASSRRPAQRRRIRSAA